MSKEEKEKQITDTDEIKTFKVGLHPLPGVDATPEEIQEFIDGMPYSEEKRKDIQKVIEEEENKSADSKT